jgi:serine/threonine protein kinase
MAKVYRAWDQRLQVWRAIKILEPEYAMRRKLRARFESEAHAMARMEHRNIVKVYDIGSDGDIAYLVMELAEGGTPIEWLERHGAMPARMAVDVILDVCDGIAAAHAAGIIHRDIKPHNVLITLKGECRVTDFGIAQLETDTGQLTRTGAVMGTLGYMAPEQRNDAKHVDQRADVYSISATLYTLLTNRTVMDLFFATQDLTMLKGVPSKLVPVIIRGTEYRPEKRYQTVSELADALRAIRDSLPDDPDETPSLVMPAGAAPPVPKPRGRSSLSVETFPDGVTPPPASANPTLLPPSTGQAQPSFGRPVGGTIAPPPTEQASKPLPTYQPSAPVADYAPPEGLYEEAPELQRGEDIGVSDEDKKHLRQSVFIGEEDEEESPAPHTESGINPLKELWLFLMELLNMFIKFMAGPGKFLVPPFAIMGAGVLVVVIMGQRDMGMAWTAVDETETVLITAVTVNQSVVEDLAGMGANVHRLEQHRKRFEETTGYEKTAAARQFAILATRAVEQASTTGGRADETFQQTRQQVGVMKRALVGYDAAVDQWHEAASGSRASVAISLGLVSSMPTEVE